MKPTQLLEEQQRINKCEQMNSQRINIDAELIAETENWQKLKNQITDVSTIKQNPFWKAQTQKEVFEIDPYQTMTYFITSKLTSNANFASEVYKQSFFEVKPSWLVIAYNKRKDYLPFIMKCLFMEQFKVEKLNFNQIYDKQKNQLKIPTKLAVDAPRCISLGMTVDRSNDWYKLGLMNFFVKCGNQVKDRQICRIFDTWIQQRWKKHKYLQAMMLYSSIFEEMAFFFSFRSIMPNFSFQIETNFELSFSIWVKINDFQRCKMKIYGRIDIKLITSFRFTFFVETATIQFKFRKDKCILNVIYNQFYESSFNCVMKKDEMIRLNMSYILQNILQMEIQLKHSKQNYGQLFRNLINIIWIPPIMLANVYQVKYPRMNTIQQRLKFCEKGVYVVSSSFEDIIFKTYPKLYSIYCPTMSIPDQLLRLHITPMKMHIKFFSLVHLQINNIYPSALIITHRSNQVIYSFKVTEDPKDKLRVAKMNQVRQQIVAKMPLVFKITITDDFKNVKYESNFSKRYFAGFDKKSNKEQWNSYFQKRQKLKESKKGILKPKLILQNILHLSKILKKDYSSQITGSNEMEERISGSWETRLQKLRKRYEQS